jgi:next-to-BRCA1 protein 1
LAVGPTNETRHRGIFCDGPLCGKSGQHQSYITGVRYKCAICPDFDLCGNCEAHPDNKHNASHPMIKFKTAIRGVSVSTFDDQMPRNSAPLGDILPFRTAPSYAAQRSASTTTLPAYTPTVAPVSCPAPQYVPAPVAPVMKELEGHFVKDTIADGTTFTPDWAFQQTWTVRNPGPQTWPAGITVCHVGGDNMLNLDRNRPVSVADLGIAQKSNSTTSPTTAGQEATFTVNMRAPTREGKHISYWRLKSADGTPFGHKLWCDIEVKGLKPFLSAMFSLPADSTSNSVYNADVHRQIAQNSADKWSMGFEKREEATSLQADALKEKLALYMKKVEEITAQAATEKAAIVAKTAPKTKQASVEDEAEAKLKESQVIMPTLERDGTPSASASMHDLPATSEVENKPESETVEEDDIDELDDVEFESADAGSEIDDEDDGFLTDEEYDILDASDDEVRGM